jgi:hypothetical protein
MEKNKDRFDVHVKIKNVTAAQAIAIESFLSMWEILGGLGGSRWTSFFSDGDGNFRPKVEFNGRKAKHTEMLDKNQLWEGSQYKIDFDSIAWILMDKEEERIKEEKFLRTPFIINKIRSTFTSWKDWYVRRTKQKRHSILYTRHKRSQWENDQGKQPREKA